MKEFMQQISYLGLPVGIWLFYILFFSIGIWGLLWLWREGDRRINRWNTMTPEQKGKIMIRRLRNYYGDEEVDRALRCIPEYYRSDK